MINILKSTGRNQTTSNTRHPQFGLAVWGVSLGSGFATHDTEKYLTPISFSLRIITLKSKKMNESWTEIQHEIFVMKVGRFK